MTALDTDGITELEKFGPERVDAVDQPANGFPFLMLKMTGTSGDAAPAETEAHVTATATETTDSAQAPEVTPAAEPAPAVVKSGEPDTVTVSLPKDVSLSISPADLAKLATLRQDLAKQEAEAKAMAKRDFDPDTGGGVDRDKLKDSDFVFPDERDFPVVKPGDVSDAVSSWGQYKGKHSFDQFKAKLTALARRKGKAFVAELPKSWGEDAGAAKAARKPKGGKGKKPFPGAAPPFKAQGDADGSGSGGDSDGDGQDENDGEDDGDAEKASGAGEGDGGDTAACCPECGEKEAVKGAAFCAKCGSAMKSKTEKSRACPSCAAKSRKGAAFCAKCGCAMDGGSKAAKAKNATAEPQDKKVDAAIGRLNADADAALAAQHADPDNTTHPADAKVDEALEHVKEDVATAADAQRRDEATDDPAEHEAKKSADTDGAAYHLVRLHDATCAAFKHDDVVIRHPAVEKGIGYVTDPQPFADLCTAAMADDGGTGSRAAELPGLSDGWTAALALKRVSAQDGLLEDAMDGLRKAFADAYPGADVKPGEITPGQFRRPYISAGHATQSAGPGQKPRIPLASHVPDPGDFSRPLITDGREAASPGSAVKAGRTYYTNEARDAARGALQGMHDYIASKHPDICPMSGGTFDGEEAVPGSMGSSLTTAQPVPAIGKNQAHAVPVPVSAGEAAAVVTPNVTKAERKAAKRAAKAARREAEMTGNAQHVPGATELSAANPAIDPELLKSALREVVAEQLEPITKTNGDLIERIAALESSPDPAQMGLRSGAAGIEKSRGEGQEAPAGGSEAAVERITRLAKRAKDPDGSVRTAAIGELMETVGREAAVELLAVL